MTFFFFQEKSTARAFCAFVSAVPVPTRLGSSPLRKQTGPAGGGWKLGHRPEEFRSLGRLSTSELCSLPMVPAAVAAKERWARRSPLRRRDDWAGAGDRDATQSVGAAAGPTWGDDAPGPRGCAGGGGPKPLFGEQTRKEAQRSCTKLARFLRGTLKGGGGERPASSALAAGGRRRFHSLARAPQARSFRDADWRRWLRAAISSGLESPTPPPKGGRVG